LSIFVAIVGLGFLIFVHEFGHFAVARAVGLRPRRFYVGFPPAIVKTTRNGIEYGLGAIPLGGFVKIPGMHRPAPMDVDHHFAPASAEAPALAGPLDRLRRAFAENDIDGGRAALVELRERRQTVELSPAAARAFDRGLNELDDAVGPDAYWRAPTWKRLAAIAAGPGANIVLSLVLFAILFATGGGAATTTVESVVPGSPAAAAGLRGGDRIEAIDGVPVEASEIAERINASQGRPITLTVTRDGERTRIGPVRPRLQEGRYRVGFVLSGEGLGLADSAWQSLRVTGIVTKEIGASLGRLVTGEGRNEISSPVGIVQGSSTAAQEGTQNFLWVLGLISLSLALLNLLPLLPLDGGHIAFSLIEGARGRAVRREVYERVSAVGIVFVVLLFVIGLSNDIGRL
jgi:regulator of sigma E protease